MELCSNARRNCKVKSDFPVKFRNFCNSGVGKVFGNFYYILSSDFLIYTIYCDKILFVKSTEDALFLYVLIYLGKRSLDYESY